MVSDRPDRTVKDLLLSLSGLTVTELFIDAIFPILDLFWSGRISQNAVATIGVTEPVMSLIISSSLGFGFAVNAVIGHYVGSGDLKKAAQSTVHVFLVAIGLGLCLTFLAFPIANTLLGLLFGELPVNSALYQTVVLIGSIPLVLLALINAVFRGAGKPSLAVKTLLLVLIVDVVLGPYLAFGIGMGLPGLGVATIVARSSGVLYQLHLLLHKGEPFPVNREAFQFDALIVKRLLAVGGLGAVQFYISDVSWLVLTALFARLGVDALTAYTVVFRVIHFSLVPCWGIGNAVAALVALRLGAKQLDLVRDGIRKGSALSVVTAVATSLCLWISPQTFIKIFLIDNSPSAGLAQKYLPIAAAGSISYALAIVGTEAFAGAGDTYTPTILSLVCYVLVEIPAAYIVTAVLGIGGVGIILIVPICETLYAVLCFWLLHKKNWNQAGVMRHY